MSNVLAIIPATAPTKAAFLTHQVAKVLNTKKAALLHSHTLRERLLLSL